ncbi:MAG: alpha/beta hydrolase [Bilifractor sp.]
MIRIITGIILAFVLSVALLLYFGLYSTFRAVLYNTDRWKRSEVPFPTGEGYDDRQKEMHALVDQMHSLPFEAVRIQSFDGITLYGRYYEVREGAPLQIQFHGYRGDSMRDMAGANKIAREAGQNTLVVDQRAHGKSGGNITTFGVRERMDVLSWSQYAAERFGPGIPMILSGVSMGAATVLMAAALDLPDNVVGIIADCSYTSPEAIVRDVAGARHYPEGIVWWLVRTSGKIFGHTDLAESSPVEAIRHSRVPVLLIHGDADRYVPVAMSRELYRAAEEAGVPARLEIFSGGAHGISYLTDVPRYTRLEREFTAGQFQKYMQENKRA